LPNTDKILGSHTKQIHNYHYTNRLSSYEKLIYRAAVSQRLRNTALQSE